MNKNDQNQKCAGSGKPSEEPGKQDEQTADSTQDILIVVATDTMGKEEEIGKVLMKGFFETMKATKEIPHTIFFLNAGVRLTTVDDEVLPTLKEIEAMGVEIYSCGTCLKYYDLEDKLQVGHRGSSYIVVEGIQDFKRTVWIG
jgi:selenium metabolism protein YedF